MHRYLMASVAALAFGIGAASAADLGARAPAPIYTRAPIASPPSSWTGAYLGAEGGYGISGDPTVTVSPNDPLASLPGILGLPLPPASFKDSGAFGGVTAGYNWQIGRSWLIGIETDFSGADIKGSGTASYTPGAGATALDSFSQKLDWFGTVRPRVGWLATDNLLLYGTGGFAYGHIEEQGSAAYSVPFSFLSASGFSFFCLTPNVPCLAGNSSRIAMGGAVGAGAEYRIPGTSASFKVEYLFVDLPSGDNVRLTNLTPIAGYTPSSFSAAFSQSEFHTVKAGLNWHF